MADAKIRRFLLDGDAVEVRFLYDERSKRFLGEYPDFSEQPRRTPSGKKWTHVMTEGCPYADKEFGDCGSCIHFRCEQPGDLIGICEKPTTDKITRKGE